MSFLIATFVFLDYFSVFAQVDGGSKMAVFCGIKTQLSLQMT